MSKHDITDTDIAENMLVAKNKIEFAIALRKLKLNASELNIALYLGLEKLSSKDGQCNPKIKTIAQETGYHADTVKDVIRALKDLGVIAATRKRKGSVWYYFAMPDASRLAANGGQSTPVAMGVNSPLSKGGQSTPVPYELGKRKEEGEITVGAGHRDAFGGPSDSSSPIGKEAVAGSKEPSGVVSGIGKKEERKINLYHAIRDGDAESIISMIEKECGYVTDNWKSFIRKNMAEGTLNEKIINDARQAAMVDAKRTAA